MRLKACYHLIFALFFAAGIAFSALPAEAKSSSNTKISATKTAKKSTKSASKSKKSKVSSAKKRQLKKLYNARPINQEAGSKYAAVVVDASTGQVLYEKNAGELRYPASLTKMMTLYLTFDAMKRGKMSLGTGMPISAKAAEQPETNINLIEGQFLTVEDAIKALVVRSANDASVVLAEHLGGTTWNFAQLMTKKARELGMKDTVFRNPNGLPDNGQYTNAYDMARLGIALRRDFPEYYPYFKTERFDFQGVTYTTHNRVMLRYDGADGIKTGYIRASGFNLVTSVKKNGYNLVGVVLGGTSGTARDDQMISLLDRTFAQLETRKRSHLANAEPYIALTTSVPASSSF